MAPRPEASLAAVLLTQRLVDVPVEPLKAAEYWAVLDRVDDLASLLGLDAERVASASGVEFALAERMVHRFDAATAVAFALDELEQSGVRVVSSVDDGYPASLFALGHRAPPVLYAAGRVALLATPLLGIVGSRDVGEDGAQIARDAARAAAREGLGVVSGGAKGVDRLAMQGALEADGIAVGVLADSLLRTVRDPDVRRAITDGQLCVCSPYQPSSPFTVANAMGRNKIIYTLSQATFVVASDLEQGGTWGGATEALRRNIVPVLVWTGAGEGPGNEKLIQLGAKGVASIDDLFPLPGRVSSVEASPSQQLALEV
jgi:predicted Rossmann fold nucleotide-binding protein DprA/Smf involved in DNA uptake